jgi:hypothetical protein
MLVEYPVALARADKNLKKDIPWISVSAVGMFLGSPTDIQRIGPMSEIDIFWTSTGLTCVMWDDCYWDVVFLVDIWEVLPERKCHPIS